MRLLVTGGSGFLGHFLVRRLVETGAEITWLRHRRAFEGDLGGSSIDLDLASADHDGWRALARAGPFDGVIHGAAMSSPVACRLDPGLARAVNVEASLRLGALAASWKARFVFLSSDVVFDGRQPPYGEADEPRPGTVYGRSKAEAEAGLRAAGLELCVLRPSLMYRLRGTGPAGGTREWLLRALERGERPRLYRNQIRHPVLADDVARVLVAVLGAGSVPPLLHVGGRQALSRFDFGRAQARHFGLPSDGIEGVDYDPQEDEEPSPLDLHLDLRRLRAFFGEDLIGASRALGYNEGITSMEEEP